MELAALRSLRASKTQHFRCEVEIMALGFQPDIA